MSNNGYFQSPCRKRVTTRQVDLDGNDFNIAVTAEAGAEEGEFDIVVTLAPKPNFGDVAEFVTAGDASLFDAADSESAVGTDNGPNTDGTPSTLVLTFDAVAQTEDNVNSTWKIVVANLQVVTKGGQTMAIPTISKTFPSPL